MSETTKTTVVIKIDLLKKLKIEAVNKSSNASAIIEKALEEYFEKIDQESK